MPVSTPPRAPGQTVVAVVALGLLLVLATIAGFAPVLTVAGMTAGALFVAVLAHPPVAAYSLLLFTPLVAGMERGTVLPAVRPHEAIAALVVAALFVRAAAALVVGRRLNVHLDRLDCAVLALAVLGSIVPMLWMIARGLTVTSDDLFYALTLWKYFALFLLVRVSVRTEREVRTALWVALAAGAVVGVVGILQALNLFGVPDRLTPWAPLGDVSLLHLNRATSTVGQFHAVGAMMTFNLAICLGWLFRIGTHRGLLLPAVGLFAMGAVASGTFSAVLGLGVALLSVGYVTGRLGKLTIAGMGAAGLAWLTLRPVIDRRLAGFDTPTGLPPSWSARLENVQTYFWPELGNGYQWLLGVRPSARVPAPEGWREWVFIESGHVWLLWTGGIPLVVAFIVFLWISMRETAAGARARHDAVGAASVASFAALWVVAVLMIFDPHLTLRGSGDLNFALLALATGVAALREQPNGPYERNEPCESRSMDSVTSDR